MSKLQKRVLDAAFAVVFLVVGPLVEPVVAEPGAQPATNAGNALELDLSSRARSIEVRKASAGALSLRATGGIDFSGAERLTVAGGNLAVTSTSGSVTFGNGTSATEFAANGGSLIFLAQQDVVGGTGNSFAARAMGTTKSSSGGGIELASGTNLSGLKNAFGQPGGSEPDAGALGTSVEINNLVSGTPTGVVQATTSGGGMIDLSTSDAETATLKLNRGAILFNAEGAGSTVEFDGSTFSVEGLLPISYLYGAVAPPVEPVDVAHNMEAVPLANVLLEGASRAVSLTTTDRNSMFSEVMPERGVASITVGTGNVLLHPLMKMIVKTQMGDIHVRRNALVSIDSRPNILRVTACSGPGDIRIVFKGREIVVHPGQEVVVSHELARGDRVIGKDGIGRRRTNTEKLPNGLVVTLSDISLVSLIHRSGHFQALRCPALAIEKKIASRLIRMAAALDQVTRMRGPYSAHQRAFTDLATANES